MASDATTVEVAGREVRVSSPGKEYFPARHETKLDLVEYYLSVGDAVIAHLGDRPVMLQRFPEGARGDSFFQKRIPASAPDWLTTTEVSTPSGTTSNALVIADLAHLVWAVNLGCVGFHAWAQRASDPDHTDELRIDLDPQPGTTFDMVRAAAAATRDLFDELGLDARPKTSGSRGIHVYLRLEPRWDAVTVRAAAVAVARELERRDPGLFTAAWWKEERGERIFVDFNQNAPHKTVFASWSVRAFDHAPVSCPFDWDELDAVSPPELTIASVPARVEANGDPWASMAPQSLDPLLALVRRDQEAGLADAPWPPQYPKMPGEPPRVQPSRARKD